MKKKPELHLVIDNASRVCLYLSFANAHTHAEWEKANREYSLNVSDRSVLVLSEGRWGPTTSVIINRAKAMAKMLDIRLFNHLMEGADNDG